MFKLQLTLGALLVCASGLANASVAGKVCFEDQTITSLTAGQSEGSKGPDSGDAVYFKLSNGRTFPLNYSYNLDSDHGRALFQQLQLALVSGMKVKGIDHNGTLCDDVDEIEIKY